MKSVAPVSVCLCLLATRGGGVFGWRAEWNDLYKRAPHKRKLISRHRILLLSSPLPEFHSPPVASSTT